jgi:hypothetical protein
LKFACQQYELFDANKRLVEIHQMHEMLLKIQSGGLDAKEMSMVANATANLDYQISGWQEEESSFDMAG